MIRKAGALILAEKKLLIVRPYGKPFFINPGGKYEEGESAIDCLRRELKEELDVVLNGFKEYRTYNLEKAAHSNDSLSLELYLVSYSGEVKPSSEIEIVEWMSKEDFYAKRYNLAPSFEKFVSDLIRDDLL